MPRNLCLIRPCLGLTTRIECVVRPLARERTLDPALRRRHVRLPAFGDQGPGAPSTDRWWWPKGCCAIADCLAQQGYIEAVDPPIWRLHLQGELRRLNGERRPHVGDYLFRPES